jgi:hypothetical protein
MKEHKQNIIILKSYDEQIATKASKVEYFELRNVSEKSALKSDIVASETAIFEKVSENRSEIDDMRESLSELQKTMSTAVYEAVKNAHKTISKGHEKLQKRRENKVTI